MFNVFLTKKKSLRVVSPVFTFKFLSEANNNYFFSSRVVYLSSKHIKTFAYTQFLGLNTVLKKKNKIFYVYFLNSLHIKSYEIRPCRDLFFVKKNLQLERLNKSFFKENFIYSWKYFINKLFKKYIILPTLDTSTEVLIRKSFYGGVASLVKPNVNNVYFYDVNNFYPFCMLKQYPVSYPKKIYSTYLPCREMHFTNFFYYIKPNSFLYKRKYNVLLRTEILKNSVLFCKEIHPNSSFFAREIYHFKKKRYFWPILKNILQRDINKRILKKILVNIYGRFGLSYLDINKRSNFIPIAAALTSYSRCFFWEMIKNLDNLFYFDTDSFFLTAPVRHELIKPKFGFLKTNYKKNQNIISFCSLSTKMYTISFLSPNSIYNISKIRTFRKSLIKKDVFLNSFYRKRLKLPVRRLKLIKCKYHNHLKSKRSKVFFYRSLKFVKVLGV